MSSNSVCNHTVINKSDSCFMVIRFCYSLVCLRTELDSTLSYYHCKAAKMIITNKLLLMALIHFDPSTAFNSTFSNVFLNNKLITSLSHGISLAYGRKIKLQLKKIAHLYVTTSYFPVYFTKINRLSF